MPRQIAGLRSLACKNNRSATQTKTYFFFTETQNPCITKASDRTPVNRRSERLRCIVDDANASRGGKFYDSFDVGGITKQVRHDDRSGFSSQSGVDGLDPVRFSSSPTSASTGVAPAARMGGTTALQQNVGIDDFVAMMHPDRAQREFQSQAPPSRTG